MEKKPNTLLWSIGQFLKIASYFVLGIIILGHAGIFWGIKTGKIEQIQSGVSNSEFIIQGVILGSIAFIFLYLTGRIFVKNSKRDREKDSGKEDVHNAGYL